MIVRVWELTDGELFDPDHELEVRDPDAVVEIMCSVFSMFDEDIRTSGCALEVDTREVPRLAAALGFEGAVRVDVIVPPTTPRPSPPRTELSRRLETELKDLHAERDTAIAEALRKLT